MFKLCFNKNGILKQSDEITIPVMILKPYLPLAPKSKVLAGYDINRLTEKFLIFAD